MVLIPPKTAPRESETSSKLSQSQNWKPIDILFALLAVLDVSGDWKLSGCKLVSYTNLNPLSYVARRSQERTKS
jgi:hypothetical protein